MSAKLLQVIIDCIKIRTCWSKQNTINYIRMSCEKGLITMEHIATHTDLNVLKLYIPA